MTNLAGHDLPTLVEAFGRIRPYQSYHVVVAFLKRATVMLYRVGARSAGGAMNSKILTGLAETR